MKVQHRVREGSDYASINRSSRTEPKHPGAVTAYMRARRRVTVTTETGNEAHIYVIKGTSTAQAQAQYDEQQRCCSKSKTVMGATMSATAAKRAQGNAGAISRAKAA